jgi:2-polyprenyl-3-methyl-5-hydroxy-6-metoxy-1,4-benzoquinol methylase
MAFYDARQFWNERFNRQDFIFGKAPNTYLVDKAVRFLNKPQRILCIADGEGRNGVWLAKQGHDVDGFDVSDIALDKAKRFAAENDVKIHYSLSDVDSWNWEPNSYDAIVAIFIQFADPEMRERLFRNIVSSLKPGGKLILQGYTQKQLEYKTGGPILIEHLYTDEMIRSLVSGFEILELNCYDADLNEGTRHIGRSALLGLFAQKTAKNDLKLGD